MSSSLLTQIKHFLTRLDPTQNALLDLFRQKRAAIAEARADDLVRLADTEAELIRQMQAHLAMRREILNQADHAGFRAGNLKDLVGAIGGDERHSLIESIDAARHKALSIRNESWVQWIASQRALLYLGELLELIAHCGQKAPTYSIDGHGPSTGGAILDASI